MNTDPEELLSPQFDGSLTEGLVSLIRNKPVGQADLDAMALFTLDGIANMLAGRRSVPGEKLLAYLKGKEGDTGRRALVMGGLTHILEVDDLHKASVVHPACVTIPAALAIAGDDMPTGPEFLKAILFGFRGLYPCRHVGRQGALQNLAQHRDLRHVWGCDDGGDADGADGCRNRARAWQCRNAIRRVVGVSEYGGDEQASACRARRRGGGCCCRTGAARIYRTPRHS